MNQSASTSDVESSKLCQLCQASPRKYTCPRCSIHYCSLECYKSTTHLDCSEEFYKEWVETELKSQANDPSDKKKMVEMLKRFYDEQTNLHEFDEGSDDEDTSSDKDISCEPMDSDDEVEVSDLNMRIADIDLNNADDLWTVLTDAEKQEFEAMIRNGDEYKLLPQWKPWWTKVVQDKLVKDLDESEEMNFKQDCPQIIQIAPIAAVERASPLMCYNLLNILNAYALMTLHYNGEHESLAMEASAFFLQLNEVIGNNSIFEDAQSAISTVQQKAIDYGLISEDIERHVLLDPVKRIIRGPCKAYHSYYMAASLSDLHCLFTKVLKELDSPQKQHLNPTFPRKFKNDMQSRYSSLTRKHVQLYIRKLEYYLVWLDKNGERMSELYIS